MSVYTISPVRQTLAGASNASYTVPTGKVFILRNVVAGTTASPSQPPLDILLDSLGAAPVLEWRYSSPVQVFAWDGRIALPSGAIVYARNNMAVSKLYVVLTGYLFDA